MPDLISVQSYSLVKLCDEYSAADEGGAFVCVVIMSVFDEAENGGEVCQDQHSVNGIRILFVILT